MATKIKKYLAGIALPLALAAPIYGQNNNFSSDLEKAAKNIQIESFDKSTLDSFFNSGKLNGISKGYDNIIQDKSKIQRNTYHFEVCPKTLKDLGPVRIDYQRFNKRWNRAYFSVDSIFDNNEIYNSGGFSILTSTNASNPDVGDLNKYHLENTNKDKTIKRRYDLFINKIYENRCLNMTVLYQEEKRTSFGEFLPGKPQ
ncbi:MAG: hypothetical protein KKE23_04065 [Nanoarchaeota archaeon]|nr:hypothetical protein [Nanoarchaeota archaeon]